MSECTDDLVADHGTDQDADWRSRGRSVLPHGKGRILWKRGQY